MLNATRSVKVLFPAKDCVPVVTRPVALVDASGIFNVIVPDDVIGEPLTFTLFPLVPVVNATDVTVPDVVLLKVPPDKDRPVPIVILPSAFVLFIRPTILSSEDADAAAFIKAPPFNVVTPVTVNASLNVLSPPKV